MRKALVFLGGAVIVAPLIWAGLSLLQVYLHNVGLPIEYSDWNLFLLMCK